MWVARAFISFCQLEYTPESPDDKRYDKFQLTLVAILTTLCTTARNDFLIYDKKLDSIIRWTNGMEMMRFCYCNRTIPVDRAALLVMRDSFFARYRWFYDPSKCIARNHQNPGNYDKSYCKENHLEESEKWKLQIGNVDIQKPVTVAVVVPDEDKKGRAGKAFKARHDNLADMNGSIDIVAKKSKPKPVSVVSFPVSPILSKVPYVPDVAVVYQKNQPASVRKDPVVSNSRMVISSQGSTFEDVQAIIRDGDVGEERIKQEARLKMVAAREQANVVIAAAKEDAKVQAEATSLMEQNILGKQRVAKEQNVLNTQNEGIT